jgi:prophage tail gpP-like protein
MATFWPRCRALLSVVLDGRGAADTAPLVVETTPNMARVCRNGYHAADTWSLEFDARAMPFDPDLIRSAAAYIYMYAADGMFDTREWAVPDFEMVRGLADDGSLSLSEDGQVISMEGRDYTGLLLDIDWDPRRRIPAGKPLDVTIQEVADLAAPPNTRARFEVVWLGTGNPPIVGRAHRSTKKKGLWVKPGKNHWDVIYEMAISHGAIAYVQGEQIIITDPNTQTELSLQRAPQLIYGRNLDSLDVSRHFTKERVPQIKMIAYDPKSGERIEVLFPESGEKVTDGFGTKKDEVMPLPAPKGICDRETLRRIARVRRADMARAEASYRAETCNLQSLDGQDLLRLQAGSPVSIGFDPFNVEQMRSLTLEQRYEHLRALNYSEQLSRFVADRYDRLDQFRQPYYLTEAEYSWSIDDGLQISIEAKNYAYEARERAQEAA